MLAVAQGLVKSPRLLMLDEPSAGLSPVLIDRILDVVGRLKRRGTAILLVEQKLSIALRISHRVYVMGHGRIVFEGTPAELKANDAVRKEWLEV